MRFVNVPDRILRALRVWVLTIELVGISGIRKLSGYNDEALRGDRRGQRSSRLNRANHVIYTEEEDGLITSITVLEVNKHDY